MKIYTKTGDKGKTSLFGGQRVSKVDIRVEAYGTVDELNSAIGVAVAQTQISLRPELRARAKLKSQNYSLKLKTELQKIQHDLFEIGSTLANPTTNSKLLTANLDKRVEGFEKLIDQLTGKLPELRNFILPGGGKAGSFLHLARSVSRRAERRVVELSKKEQVDDNILKYLNRLSDLLFTMARFVNYKDKDLPAGRQEKEIIWNPSKV